MVEDALNLSMRLVVRAGEEAVDPFMQLDNTLLPTQLERRLFDELPVGGYIVGELHELRRVNLIGLRGERVLNLFQLLVVLLRI